MTKSAESSTRASVVPGSLLMQSGALSMIAGIS